MTTAIDPTPDQPVHKTITVQASPERAFQVFTGGIDTWWPRTHHIGQSAMTKTVIECYAGGRCYSEQADGTECVWRSILAWEPPHRFVMAWQIDQQWKYQPDPAQSSEVEVRFTPEEGGATRVDLEHRHFNRLGAGADTMRTAVASPMGWAGLLRGFAVQVD